MKKNYQNFKIIIEESYESICGVTADIIAKFISAKPDGVLGFATGSTPLGVYSRLSELHKAGKADFAHIKSFNLDEYHPIEKTDSQSYNYYMNDNLFSHINIDPKNIGLPNGAAKDALAECTAYEQKISDAGGIDLQLLGLGHNGHIGFNEPSAIFSKTTHYTPLTESTITANSRLFASPDMVPKHAITMGIGTIFSAKQILLLICGESKADIVEKVLFGDIDPMVPGSILQLHPDVTLLMDAAASKKVAGRLR